MAKCPLPLCKKGTFGQENFQVICHASETEHSAEKNVFLCQMSNPILHHSQKTYQNLECNDSIIYKHAMLVGN